MRTNRRAGVALLVLLATAVPPRAAESTASAQASSPAISTQSVQPSVPRHGIKAAAIPAEQRKAAAQMIPARTVPQGTRAASGNAAQRLLRFEDFQRGLELVPVKKSGPALPAQPRQQARPMPAPVVPVTTTGKPAILRRLPPVDRIAPAAPIPQRSRLPQEPIALYPETGYE